MRHLCLANDREVTVVNRTSGHIDLYWNRKRICSSEDNEIGFRYKFIRMNFSGVLLRRENVQRHVKMHTVLLSF